MQRKAHLLATLSPTIAILPESAHPDKTRSALEAIGATKSSASIQWIGSEKNVNKGLSAVAVGTCVSTHEDWITYSDHPPTTVELLL